MEIYEFSYWKPAYLIPNIIFILTCLGVSVQIIYDILKKRMKLLSDARYQDAAAKYLLANLDYMDIPCINNGNDKGYSYRESVWNASFVSNLLSDGEVFLTKFMQIIIESEVKLIRNEYKIYLNYDEGALLYGCIDEFKILNKNEIFIQTYDKCNGKWDIWDNKRYPKCLGIYSGLSVEVETFAIRQLSQSY
eukprot:494608_1